MDGEVTSHHYDHQIGRIEKHQVRAVLTGSRGPSWGGSLRGHLRIRRPRRREGWIHHPPTLAPSMFECIDVIEIELH